MLTRTPARGRRSLTALLAPGLVAGLLAASLSACGGDDSPGESGQSPEEVMALAKATLDDTSGVTVTLSTDDLPDGVIGATKATGVATHPPAFDGTITVVLSGQSFDVPVIAVDGKVYAQIPLTPGWQDIDPGDYGAPDPAQLLSTDAGLSSILTASTGLEEGDSVRGGADNSEILTEYAGEVDGAAVKNILPGASGSFDATYTVTDDGELRSAVLTGVFYPETPSMTYTITFDDYGTEQDITAP